jgi:hypothetical protein
MVEMVERITKPTVVVEVEEVLMELVVKVVITMMEVMEPHLLEETEHQELTQEA